MRLTLSILILLLALTCFGQSQKVVYSYDDAGRLTNVDYGNGNVISYTYDSSGNLLKRVVTSASQTAQQRPPDRAVTASNQQQRAGTAPTSDSDRPTTRNGTGRRPE
jgi:YD repeat-containing protein